MEYESEYLRELSLYRGYIPRVMGTRMDFIAPGVDEESAAAVWKEVGDLAFRLDATFNRFSTESEVWAFNNCEKDVPFEVSDDFIDLLERAVSFWYDTEGLFDITKGKMLDLQVDGKTLVKRSPDVRLDFGGIAKGYVLEKTEEILRAGGLESAFVNFGNSTILALGHHPFGDCWKVSLPDPYGGKQLKEFNLRDSSLSTSGNTPGYSGHIVHPVTGMPVTERRVTAVLGKSPLVAEILSTVLMMADEGQKKRLLRRFRDVKAEIIDI